MAKGLAKIAKALLKDGGKGLKKLAKKTKAKKCVGKACKAVCKSCGM